MVGWEREKEAFPLSGPWAWPTLPRTGTIHGKASGHAEQRRLDRRDWALTTGARPGDKGMAAIGFCDGCDLSSGCPRLVRGVRGVSHCHGRSPSHTRKTWQQSRGRGYEAWAGVCVRKEGVAEGAG